MNSVSPGRSFRRLLFQAGIMVMTSIHFATATPFPGSLPTLDSILPTRTMAAAPAIGGQDRLMLPKSRTSIQGRRRWAISRVISIRGGSSSSNAIPSGYEDVPQGVSHFYNKVSLDDPKKPSILSTVIMIISESINIARFGMVVSGYFGAWVASWMVGKMHKHLPTMIENEVASSGGGESNNLLAGKYRLTTIASIGFLLLHTTGIQFNTIHSRMSDATFVATLWIYSRLVNPIIGGLIGCTHLSLGVVSMILGHPNLVYALDDLKDIRFKKLAQYVDGEKAPFVKAEDRTPRAPIVTSEPRNKLKSEISNMLGSASILLVFPQYFLGLYLIGCTLVSWSSTKQIEGGWKMFGNWLKWLGKGICVSYNEGGELECGINAAGSHSINGSMNPWKLSHRLVALYWIIAVAKGVTLCAIFGT